VRDALDVTITLDQIVCIDEGDGPGDAEPYLWTVFFKIDGDSVALGDSGYLVGHITTSRTDGSHGNLYNDDVGGGDTVHVPAIIGWWQTTLRPIPIAPQWKQLIKDKKGWDDIPGSAGVLCVLMEEDNLPDSAAVTGYNALATTFEAKLNEAILTLGVTQPDLSAADQLALSNAVSDAVTAAITNQLDVVEKVWIWLTGPDDTLGNVTFKFGHDDLASKGRIDFQQRWKDGVNVNDPTSDLGKFISQGPGRFITSGGEWILQGHVDAKDIPPPQTYQVVCIKSGWSGRKPFRIGDLGVKAADGTVTVLSKNDVIDRINKGDRFFTVDDKGRKAWVAVHEPLPTESPRYRYLYTTADGIEGNNLLSLPQCQ
jgi:Protein of unknown function (DUF3892)